MSSYAPAAKARVSCTRCHKRKKRCDKAIPSCHNCDAARVRCSFLDDNLQTAAYSVAYVQNLERRVREMERRTSDASFASPREGEAVGIGVALDDPSSLCPDATMRDMITAIPEPNIMAPLSHQPHLAQGPGIADLAPAEPPHITSPPIHQESSPSFVGELKTLSFEAAAERHLGSFSGISFAKLTQTVLRRLTPDKTDFVFNNGREDLEPRMFDFNSSLDLCDPALLENLNATFSNQRFLYGDVPPTDSGLEPSPPVARLDVESDQPRIDELVNFYFAHSHTLYPMLHRGDLLKSLEQIREKPYDPVVHSPLDLFRIWMVLAIGSTAYASVSLTDEAESRFYYGKALSYLDEAMACGEMAALEVIALQVSYSFFNQFGPNTWFLVGLAARLALGMGLHTASTYVGMTADMEQRRKRIFFSIYMMDRVISNALGRPFALHEDDIDVEPFSVNHDDGYSSGFGRVDDVFRTSILSIPRHILALRMIASKIARQVYSNRKAASLSTEEREEILHSLHRELIQWRRDMPFPLPDINDRVPQLTSNWFDYNYYTHLAMIYRPSPLMPTMDNRRVEILQDAASMSLRQAFAMHSQRRFAYNWLNLLSIFTSALSLIYATTVQPKDLGKALKETRAIDDLDLAIELFDTLGMKFSAANNIRSMVAEVSRRYKDLRGSAG